jgi:hypothetical protein
VVQHVLTRVCVLRPFSSVLQILNISAPLVVLDSPPAATEGQEPDLSAIQLCLLDTPGPNEAGEEGLKYQVGLEIIFDTTQIHAQRQPAQ